jgi:hypothetical protein
MFGFEYPYTANNVGARGRGTNVHVLV